VLHRKQIYGVADDLFCPEAVYYGKAFAGGKAPARDFDKSGVIGAEIIYHPGIGLCTCELTADKVEHTQSSPCLKKALFSADTII
jgi:hypothetical protein